MISIIVKSPTSWVYVKVAPSPRICEDIISGGMSSGDVVERLTGFKKFFTAWHLTRELRLPATPSLPLGFVKRDNLKRQSKNTPDPPPPRTFHRSLLLGGQIDEGKKPLPN